MIRKQSKVIIKGLSVIKNDALSGGFAYVTEESKISLVGGKTSVIKENTATYNGSLLYLDDSNTDLAWLDIEYGKVMNAYYFLLNKFNYSPITGI